MKKIFFAIILSLFIVNTAHCQTVETSPDETQGMVMTEAMKAAYHGDSARLLSMLEKGENVNNEYSGGTTLLMLAAMSPSDSASTVSLLLNYGAAYDKTDANGTSALTIAKNRGNNESATILETFYRSDFLKQMLLVGYLIFLLVYLRIGKNLENFKIIIEEIKTNISKLKLAVSTKIKRFIPAKTSPVRNTSYKIEFDYTPQIISNNGARTLFVQKYEDGENYIKEAAKAKKTSAYFNLLHLSENFLKKYPESVSANFDLADIYLKTDRIDKAFEVYDSLSNFYPHETNFLTAYKEMLATEAKQSGKRSQ